MLQSRGCVFVSETDTEVVAQLLGYLYRGNPLSALKQAIALIEGSFALAIIFADDPETIYCTCKDSPMVVGHGEGESVVASDIPAILAHNAGRVLCAGQADCGAQKRRHLLLR
jgi:glucosamine--fructose-6-phosphate aminotransferase (isomerizing)